MSEQLIDKIRSLKISTLINKIKNNLSAEDFEVLFLDVFAEGKYRKSKKDIELAFSLLSVACDCSVIDVNFANGLALRLFGKGFNSIKSKINIVFNGDESAEKNSELKSNLPYGKYSPKISIITPSYNQGQYIEETILSVINQDYPNFEYIIIDGGSTDGTVDVVNKYKKYITYFVSEKDDGQSDALNKGFLQATGEILCWINSDDQLAPGALNAVAMAFATHDVDLVAGILEVYKDGEMLERHMTSCQDGALPLSNLLDLDNGWSVGQFFYQPEVFFTKRIWNKAGSHVRTDCYFSMDYELWLRFAFHGARLHVIGVPLAKFRMHEEQKTHEVQKFKTELVKVRDRFISEKHISVYPIRCKPISKKLRVLFINDHGFQHGAGIAHERIFNAFKISGSDINAISLSDYYNNYDGLNEESLFNKCNEISPDIVIYGNTHSVVPDSVSFISRLLDSYPVLWVTHDFWIVTGKCPYTNGCQKYKKQCDDQCPVYSEYPLIDKSKISLMHDAKKNLLKHENIFILANSEWARRFILESNSGVAEDRVAVFNLGVDHRTYSIFDKASARKFFGINSDRFVIAFSVSSLSDVRKGGAELIDVLRQLQNDKISLLLIGNIDSDVDFSGLDVIKVGYLDDPLAVSAAMQAANIYVGLSREETFGQVYIEAAMAGTPSIGLNKSGVVSAIAEGVTGKLVTSEIQSSLDVINNVVSDTALLDDISRWAPVYARNEFSLEASYHSIFCAMSDLGLVDKLNLPHKIFLNSIQNEVENLDYLVNYSKGISNEEGPYPPTFSSKFRWLHDSLSEVIFIATVDATFDFEFSFINHLFDVQNVVFYVDGVELNNFSVVKNDESNLFVYKFRRHASVGRIIFGIKTKTQLSIATESRKLSLILYSFHAKF